MGSELVQIRAATRSDAQDVARVHEEAWRSTYQGIIPHLHLEKIIAHRGPAWWERTLKRPGSGMLLLTFNGIVQGYASFGAARIASQRQDRRNLSSCIWRRCFRGWASANSSFSPRAACCTSRAAAGSWSGRWPRMRPLALSMGGLAASPASPRRSITATSTLNRVAFLWEPVGRTTR